MGLVALCQSHDGPRPVSALKGDPLWWGISKRELYTIHTSRAMDGSDVTPGWNTTEGLSRLYLYSTPEYLDACANTAFAVCRSGDNHVCRDAIDTLGATKSTLCASCFVGKMSLETRQDGSGVVEKGKIPYLQYFHGQKNALPLAGECLESATRDELMCPSRLMVGEHTRRRSKTAGTQGNSISEPATTQVVVGI